MSLNLGRPRNEIDPRRIVEKVRSLDDAAAEAMIRSVIVCTKAADGKHAEHNPEHDAEWAFWEAMNHYQAKLILSAGDGSGVSEYCREVMGGLADLWQAAKRGRQ